MKICLSLAQHSLLLVLLHASSIDSTISFIGTAQHDRRWLGIRVTFRRLLLLLLIAIKIARHALDILLVFIEI